MKMLTQLMAIQSHHCSLNILTISIMATEGGRKKDIFLYICREKRRMK